MSESIPHLHPRLNELVGCTIAERYRVDSLLGVGGMGAVFRGHHLGLKRDVAIKVLHPDLSRDTEISARFDREAHSSSRLDHPNCLQVTDYGETDDGMKFMVMQLLEGGELTALLGRPLPPARAVELSVQILRGLEHAHKKGVVHRDIKPENVFITRDHEGEEVLKIVDFGIAKIVDGPAEADRHMTKAGLVFGTPAYMSPEQAAGVEADERADIYSVGIILYQMLSGTLPFDHRDPVALVRMQVSQDPPPLPANVPPVLAATVEKMLAKSRDERFESAGDAADTLEQIVPMLESGVIDRVELSPVVAAVSGPIATTMHTHLHKVARSRRGAALGGGLAVLLVAWIAWPSKDASEQVEEASGVEVAGKSESGRAADPAVEGSPAPDEASIAEIDRLLLANKLDEAEKVLTPLRDAFPRDATLSWRQGRLLSKRRRKESQALAAYGAAIDGDPELLEDKDFYSEIYELLRKPRVRDEALEIALHKMGEHGHKFLLEVVNAEKKPLSYHDRQRALEELAKSEESIALVNEPLNRALDLLQAKQALRPCVAYRDALRAIAADPQPYYEPRVRRAPLPEPPEDAADGTEGDDASACEGLEEARDEVLGLLAAMRGDEPEEEEQAEPEPASAPKPTQTKSKAKKKPAKKSAASKASKASSDECDKPFAVFKKQCR